MKTKFFNLGTWLVSTAILLIAVGIIGFATPYFGNRLLIVRSGSMMPSINVGDIVVVRPAAPYHTGDVISFHDSTRPEVLVTHRVVEVREANSSATYITKGDANNTADEAPVAENNVVGKNILTVPYVGRVLAFAKTKIGFSAFVVLPILLVVLSEIRVILRELRGKKATPEAILPTVAAAPPSRDILLKSMIGALTVLTLIPSTHALFSDSGASTDNIFLASSSFPSPTPSPSPTPPINIADHVVISEIQLRAPETGNADKDFVELYNPTHSTIDMSGWRIRNKTSSGTNDPDLIQFAAATSIQAHGFYLWANNNNGYASTINADASSTEKIADDNSIALTQSDGTTIIDGVGWGSLSGTQYTEGTVPPNLAASKSYERKAQSTSTKAAMETGGTDEFKGNGTDSDDNLNDFIIRDIPQPQNSTSAPETL